MLHSAEVPKASDAEGPASGEGSAIAAGRIVGRALGG